MKRFLSTCLLVAWVPWLALTALLLAGCVVTYYGGSCEQGTLIAKAGGKGQQTVTISCTSFAGHNKSLYEFRCGPAS